MALILGIETATTVCSIGLWDGETVIGLKETREHNSHSRVVAVFIEELLRETGTGKKKIDAVVVSKGPGSYTGLRIGVSTAKGLCYALDKPLIAINTLEALACGMKQMPVPHDINLPILYIPMIDARRMEVYLSVFNASLNPVKETKAEIITPDSFMDLLPDHHLVIAGDGADKCHNTLVHPNITYLHDFRVSAVYMQNPANESFESGKFENTAYFEPFYLKDFIAGKPSVKGLK